VLAALSLCGQTVYPGALDSAATLLQASNRAQTTLSSGINSSTLTIPVASGTLFVANSLVTIEDEIIKICSVGGSTLTACSGGRGFDGTVAASHTSGKTVRGNITAKHHNVLVDALVAVQTALGADLSNVATPTTLISSRYDFTAQTPGGSLVVGANTINLSPVPLGVNGTDANHYLYISSGVGTAEACLIIGGTAVSGAASGTVILQCANTHSGAWTVRSATAGIQEAINSLPSSGGVVVLPTGTHTLQKGFTVANRGSVTVQGQGIGATTLSMAGSGAIVTLSSGANNWVRGTSITSTGAMSSSNYAVVFDDQNSSGVDHVAIYQVPNGVQINSNTAVYGNYRIWVQYADISYLTGSGGVGIIVEGGADHFLTHIAYSDADANDLASIRVRKSGGSVLKNIDALHSGLLIDPSGVGNNVAFLFLSEALFDTTWNEPLKIAPTSGAHVTDIVLTNCWFATSTNTDGVSITASSPALAENIALVAVRVVNNRKNGINLTGTGVKDITVASSIISSNNTINGSNYHGIFVDDATGVIINGNQIGASPGLFANQRTCVFFDTGAADNVIVTNNNCKDAVTAPILGMNLMSGANRVIANNYPNTGAISSVTAAASVDLGGAADEMYFVDGNTPIATITPVWTGRTIDLIFNHATPGGLIGGGNISTPKTVTQYGRVSCRYSTLFAWSCVGP
jgi:hypothetical protein